jgi:diguanylate cyclase
VVLPVFNFTSYNYCIYSEFLPEGKNFDSSDGHNEHMKSALTSGWSVRFTKVQHLPMKTILVIEDEPTIRENILGILEINGFQALGAEDGIAGVQQAKAYHPDLILCDILMPGIDGYGVLAALRKDAGTAMIPLIFLSAKAERSDFRLGMNLGADDYLTKPFSSKELVAAVSSRLLKQTSLTQLYLDEIQQAVATLKQAAYSDLLTSLPNRVLLYQALREALSTAKQDTTIVAVLSIELNRFSLINTNFGYAVGDVLLQCLAQRLLNTVGTQGTVARLSGDEFGIILKGLTQVSEATVWVQKILATVTAPYLIQEHEIRVQMSTGVALYAQHGNHPEKLLARADMAMRWCHRQGQSYLFYDAAMDAAENNRRWIETELVEALARSEFELYYQPQVNLATGRIIGIEALLRWRHPERGMISPTAFIPIAEETGLIIPLGEWVLRTACHQAKRWQALSSTPLRISINLSMRQLQRHDVAQTVTQVLAETGLDPKLLILEITETSLMEDVEMTISTLQCLKQIGIEISIDDFGIGYSSLNYLSSLPVDSLKIDRSFINRVAIDHQAAAISTAIIAMAHSLQLSVIAEGVENRDQLAFLRKTGCQTIQGFLYSPALSVIDMQPLLMRDRQLQLATV